MESTEYNPVRMQDSWDNEQTRPKWLQVNVVALSEEPGRDNHTEGSSMQSRKPSLGRLSLTKRFSTYIRVATCASVVLLLATIGFLIFLWHSDESNPTWRRLVLTNWITRSATLAAIALRASISLQAGLATSMLASLILEGPGVRLFDLPEISVMRATNNGPHALLWSWGRQVSSGGLFLLLIMLFVSTFAAQLSSTLLLSDIALKTTLDTASTFPISYGFDPINRDEGKGLFGYYLYQAGMRSGYSNIPVTEYPSFGEDLVPDDLEQTEGVEDTGTVIRSFIPIADKATRENLQSYKGPGFAFDARTVCVQPKLESLALSGSRGGEPCSLSGLISPRHPVTNAVFDKSGLPFNCELPMAALSCSRDNISELCSEPMWTLCRLDLDDEHPVGGLIPALDFSNNASLQHFLSFPFWEAENTNNSWPVNMGSAYLLMNFSMPTDGWIVDNGPSVKNFEDYTTYSGVWAEIDVFLASKIRVSICYNAVPVRYAYAQIQDTNITMVRRYSHSEPRARTGVKLKGFDTKEIRQQLGVGGAQSSPDDRGIFNLSSAEIFKVKEQRQANFHPDCTNNLMWRSKTLTCNDDGKDLEDLTTPLWVTMAGGTMPEQVYFCLYCRPQRNHTELGGNAQASTILSSMFNEALLETGSPARALQAFFTSTLQQAYHTWLPLFDLKANATTTSFVERLAPVSRRGFWGVMAIILTHIVVCGLITVAFLYKTKFSLVGNVWTTVAQVVHSEELQEVLREGTMRTDEQVYGVLRRGDGVRKRHRVQGFGEEDFAAFAPVVKPGK